MLNFLQKKHTHYFKLWDIKQDGLLEFDEFFTLSKRIARLLGVGPDSLEYQQLYDDTLKRWEEILVYAEDKRSGKLSLSVWLNYSQAYIESVRQHGLDDMTRLMIRFIFNLVDTKHDGIIDLEEWPIFLELMGLDEAPDIHWQRLDPADQGYLTLLDFEKLRNQFFFGDDPDAPGNYLFGLFA